MTSASGRLVLLRWQWHLLGLGMLASIGSGSGRSGDSPNNLNSAAVRSRRRSRNVVDVVRGNSTHHFYVKRVTRVEDRHGQLIGLSSNVIPNGCQADLMRHSNNGSTRYNPEGAGGVTRPLLEFGQLTCVPGAGTSSYATYVANPNDPQVDMEDLIKAASSGRVACSHVQGLAAAPGEPLVRTWAQSSPLRDRAGTNVTEEFRTITSFSCVASVTELGTMVWEKYSPRAVAFVMSPNRMSWTKCYQDFCPSRSGTLACMRNNADNTAALEVVDANLNNTVLENPDWHGAWIGLRWHRGTREWTSSCSGDSAFRQWQLGEPNGVHGDQNRDQFAMMYATSARGLGKTPGNWNDERAYEETTRGVELQCLCSVRRVTAREGCHHREVTERVAKVAGACLSARGAPVRRYRRLPDHVASYNDAKTQCQDLGAGHEIAMPSSHRENFDAYEACQGDSPAQIRCFIGLELRGAAPNRGWFWANNTRLGPESYQNWAGGEGRTSSAQTSAFYHNNRSWHSVLPDGPPNPRGRLIYALCQGPPEPTQSRMHTCSGQQDMMSLREMTYTSTDCSGPAIRSHQIRHDCTSQNPADTSLAAESCWYNSSSSGCNGGGVCLDATASSSVEGSTISPTVSNDGDGTGNDDSRENEFNPCAIPGSYRSNETLHSDCNIPSSQINRTTCRDRYGGNFVEDEGPNRTRCITNDEYRDHDRCQVIGGTLTEQKAGNVINYYHGRVVRDGCEATQGDTGTTYVQHLYNFAQRVCVNGTVVLWDLCNMSVQPTASPNPSSAYTIDGGTIGYYSDAACTVQIDVDTVLDQGGVCSSEFAAGSTPFLDRRFVAGMQCTPDGNILACIGHDEASCMAAVANPTMSTGTGACLHFRGAEYSLHREVCIEDPQGGVPTRYLRWRCTDSTSSTTPTDSTSSTPPAFALRPLSEYTVMGGTVTVFSDSACTVSLGTAGPSVFDQGGTCSQFVPAGLTPIWPDHNGSSHFAGIQCTPSGFVLACYGRDRSLCDASAQDPSRPAVVLGTGCVGDSTYSEVRVGSCHTIRQGHGRPDRYIKFQCSGPLEALAAHIRSILGQGPLPTATVAEAADVIEMIENVDRSTGVASTIPAEVGGRGEVVGLMIDVGHALLRHEAASMSANETRVVEGSSGSVRLQIVKTDPNAVPPLIRLLPLGSKASIQLPKPSSGNSDGGGGIVIVEFVGTGLFRSVNTTDRLGTKVVSVSIEGRSRGAPGGTHFADGDTATLTFLRGEIGNANWTAAGCRWLNHARNSWVASGLTTNLAEDQSSLTCETTHLTSFAVLMDVSGSDGSGRSAAAPMAKGHETALSWIMYIGVGLSVVCLLLVLVLYTTFPSLRTKPKIILMNLSASLLFALILFLVVASTKIEGSACAAMAITLHYALLTTFAWMSVQGHYLHQSLTNVFAARKAKNMLRTYSLAAYLVPGLFVLAAALTWPAAYGREGLCWLNGANGGIWLFAGPALLVCVINLSFLVQIIKTVYALPPAPTGKTMVHGRIFDVAAAKRGLQAAMSFSVVMGLTWLFGLLSLVEGAELWYQYVFSVFNASLGFFIFYFHAVKDPEVRKKCRGIITDGQAKPSTMSMPGMIKTSGGSMKKAPRGGRSWATINPVVFETTPAEGYLDVESVTGPITAADIGTRVHVDGYDSPGTLRFVGVHAVHGQPRCGVELDKAIGKNNGTVQGNVYFVASDLRGVLVKPAKVTRAGQPFKKEDEEDKEDKEDNEGEEEITSGFASSSEEEDVHVSFNVETGIEVGLVANKLRGVRDAPQRPDHTELVMTGFKGSQRASIKEKPHVYKLTKKLASNPEYTLPIAGPTVDPRAFKSQAELVPYLIEKEQRRATEQAQKELDLQHVANEQAIAAQAAQARLEAQRQKRAQEQAAEVARAHARRKQIRERLLREGF